MYVSFRAPPRTQLGREIGRGKWGGFKTTPSERVPEEQSCPGAPEAFGFISDPEVQWGTVASIFIPNKNRIRIEGCYVCIGFDMYMPLGSAGGIVNHGTLPIVLWNKLRYQGV